MRTHLCVLLLALSSLPNLASQTAAFYVIETETDDRARSQRIIQERVVVENYVVGDRYIVHATPAELDALASDGVIRGYSSYYEVFSDLVLGGGTANTFDICLFDHADQQSVLLQLRRHATIEAELVGTIRVSGADLDACSRIEGVEYIERTPSFSVTGAIPNNVANGISGTIEVRQRLGLLGQGQIIGVADTGLDTGVIATVHADFSGRILSLQNVSPNLTIPWDKMGHGTHVAGSVLGSGVLSGSSPTTSQYGNSYAGGAPEAQLVMQALGDDTGSGAVYLTDPISVTLFEPAYQLGATVHNNSWVKSIQQGWYEKYAAEVDKSCYKNKDLLIVFPVGNRANYGWVMPPSTAKNCLAVASVETSNPNTIAGSSSKGFTADERIKPEVASPGVDIISTHSSVGRIGPISSNPNYSTISGTSMAAPNVTAMAALIREYYIGLRGTSNPSAALVKATLINGAVDIGYGTYSREAGFGRANLTNSLPLTPADLLFIDETQGLSTGQQMQFSFVAGPGQPIAAALVWTDPEAAIQPFTGKKLVNDLDLVIVDPQGTAYHGNDITAPFDDTRDSRNNVERIVIASPVVTGNYTVTVSANNVPIGAQDFALVIHHDEAGATCAFRNGSGINPIGYTCTTNPALGTTWQADIALSANTTATFLGLAGAPSPGIPFLGSEVLIQLSPAIFVAGLGSYSVPIPSQSTLLGAVLPTQGFRLDGASFVMLNAQDLTIGL